MLQRPPGISDLPRILSPARHPGKWLSSCLSNERLRQLTNQQGQTLAKAHRAQAEQVLKAAVSMEQIRAQREQRFSLQRDPCRMVAGGTDGGWVPRVSKNAAWRARSGWWPVTLTLSASTGYWLNRRRYVATFGAASEVGLLTYAAACDLGATEAPQQVVLGDGADWIKTQARAFS